MNGECSVFPLLTDPSTYVPDTLDLNSIDFQITDREYWFNCFTELVPRFSQQAAKSQSSDPTSCERASSFKNDYIAMLTALRNDSQRCKPLGLMKLLDLNQTYLGLHGFMDPWEHEKRSENSASILQLKQRLDELDKYDWRVKWVEIIKGILAGNIFDWGAHAVTQILETNKRFGLDDALKCIQPRPWLIDSLDKWLDRLECGTPHKCAVIFVDNSGVDIVLGIIPFARELLIRGTKVILCANSQPALNDITYDELTDVIRRCCSICKIIKCAYELNNLLVVNNGQNGPCLNLKKISSELCTAIINNNADLLVIEGMGRALHTNFNARFSCETLKLAVIKNQWWANKLGGDTFAIICKYETI